MKSDKNEPPKGVIDDPNSGLPMQYTEGLKDLSPREFFWLVILVGCVACCVVLLALSVW